MRKQETLEYGLLQHIKMCLECNNESQAIRLLEKYSFEKQEGMYSEEYMNQYADYVLMCSAEKTFKLPLPPKEWFEQFKNK